MPLPWASAPAIAPALGQSQADYRRKNSKVHWGHISHPFDNTANKCRHNRVPFVTKTRGIGCSVPSGHCPGHRSHVPPPVQSLPQTSIARGIYVAFHGDFST